MINVSFQLRNPLNHRFGNVFEKGWLLSKNKAFSIDVLETSTILGFELTLTFRQDHAGLAITIAGFGYDIELTLYDVRHWNYEKGCWYVYDSKGERR